VLGTIKKNQTKRLRIHKKPNKMKFKKGIELNKFQRIPTDTPDDHSSAQDVQQFPESDSIYDSQSTAVETQSDQSLSNSMAVSNDQNYDDEMTEMPRSRQLQRLPDGSWDMDSACESGEWGNVTPILDIGFTTIIKGPGCEPITPLILFTIILTIYIGLISYMKDMGDHAFMACSLLTLGAGGLLFNLFITSFTDPGFIHRKHDKQLAYSLQD
jgi:hypothetical protein